MLHLLLLATLQPLVAQTHPNLIVNGDFSQGNKGFTSDYKYDQDLSPTGNFYIGANPHDYHMGGASMSAHSGDHGMMLILNGATSADTAIWQQTVKVLPNHRYFFGVWAASWGRGMEPDSDPSPAKLTISINGKAISAQMTLEAKDGVWKKFYVKWNSGSAQSAVLRIVDDNLDWFGNDFAIGDLVFHD